ncbi:hypothetical protein OROGR_000646 [Orobanche gracilis]
MLLYKQKKNQVLKGNRFLVSVTVLGSAGPIRFVVNEDELVAAVIDNALKSYAREGRLPVLGCDPNDFMLYSPVARSEGTILLFLLEHYDGNWMPKIPRYNFAGSDHNFKKNVPLSYALLPWDTIGSFGVRSFLLCKKPKTTQSSLNAIHDGKASAISRKGGTRRWKSWFHKSFNPKISSH